MDLQPIFHAFLFWVIGGLTAASAIATVVTHNIVRAATWLLFTLGGTSALFFLIGADLVGAVQLLVYVGGTMVLVVFGVMLTAQGPFISDAARAAREWAVSAATGITLLALLFLAIMSNQTVRRASARRRRNPVVVVRVRMAQPRANPTRPAAAPLRLPTRW